MSLKFGTDGVRGVANVELTPEIVLALGRAAARVLGADEPFVVGRDPRESGPQLQAALHAGLTAEGASIVDLGVVPTATVAQVAAHRRAPGAMVSASHNPYQDNGIKFFAEGRKLRDDVEERLEAELHALVDGAAPAQAPARVGTVLTEPAAVSIYIDKLLACLQGRRLDGLHVVLDCANGAASHVAPGVFRHVGATVTVLHDAPDGRNINDDCGSTHPSSLQRAVTEHGADVGLAFDGDADRVIASDASGELVDGDQIMAICALDMRDQGLLVDDTLVVTVMSNLGLKLAMQAHAITVVETQVGDRYVLEALERGGWSLGGEQSGHVLFPQLAPTGDGLLTGLQLVDAVCRAGKPLAELAAVVTRLPQVLHNVTGVDRDALTECAPVWAAVEAAEATLGGQGRVLLRPSGTEPLIRVMVEARTHDEAERVATELATVVRTHLG